MGKIEESVRKRAKKQNIQRAVLSAVATAGVISLAMLAPNALQLLAFTPPGKRKGKYHANRTIDRLMAHGEIVKKTHNGKQMLSLSTKGQLRLARLTLAELGRKVRRWDGRWRIVIFDIPEKYRGSRDALRQTLIAIGFLKLQESVWVYPYDCEDLVALLKTSLFSGSNVLYIVSEHVENDRWLRKEFRLRLDD